MRPVQAEAARLGLITKIHVGPQGHRRGGIPFGRGRLYHLLQNPVYIGRIVHKDRTYPGPTSRSSRLRLGPRSSSGSPAI